MRLVAFLAFLVGTIIFFLIAVKVDLGDKLRWDFLGLFSWGVAFCLCYLPPLPKALVAAAQE